MLSKERKDFCIECRKDTEYVLQKKSIKKTIKDKEYQFMITVALCTECGEEISVLGLLDKNIQEIDEQYRIAEGIISINDIEKLTELYKIGKAPLSLALGFGEVTIARYLAGQIPSKEYSDIMKSALTSPAYMENMLIQNRDKISETAYSKALMATKSLKNLFSVSDKMLRVISYIFKNLVEVTPLMLQKLLYFIQGMSYALLGRPMFVEDCEAWIHGPVYPEVYNLFRNFKYNPIDDVRFVLLEGTADELTSEERRVIDLVLNTFGVYGGKVLEKITHNEAPWKNARKGYSDSVPSKEPLSKDSIKAYYELINKKYNVGSVEGINRYISDMKK